MALHSLYCACAVKKLLTYSQQYIISYQHLLDTKHWLEHCRLNPQSLLLLFVMGLILLLVLMLRVYIYRTKELSVSALNVRWEIFKFPESSGKIRINFRQYPSINFPTQNPKQKHGDLILNILLVFQTRK